MKAHLDPEQLKTALASGLPGVPAQQLMAPEERDFSILPADPVPAGVMVLFYPSGQEEILVFIKRKDDEGPHGGQVSFPGGALEPGDGSLQETALRESREELGITAPVQVLGPLTELHIPVSNYLVSPFVGRMEQRPLFRPDPGEVQYIIEAPLQLLLDEGSRETGPMHRHGRWIRTPHYRVGKEQIWGATAMILSEFLQLVSRLQ